MNKFIYRKFDIDRRTLIELCKHRKINKLSFKNVTDIAAIKQKLSLIQVYYEPLNDHTIAVYKQSDNHRQDIEVISEHDIWLSDFDMRYRMFADLDILELDLSNTHAKSISALVLGASIETLSLGNIDVKSTYSLSRMCRGCTHLKSIDFGTIDLSNTFIFSQCFYDCKQLTKVDFKDNKVILRITEDMLWNNTSLREIHMKKATTTLHDSELTEMYDTNNFRTIVNAPNLKFIDLSSITSDFYTEDTFKLQNEKECKIKFKDKTLIIN